MGACDLRTKRNPIFTGPGSLIGASDIDWASADMLYYSPKNIGKHNVIVLKVWKTIHNTSICLSIRPSIHPSTHPSRSGARAACSQARTVDSLFLWYLSPPLFSLFLLIKQVIAMRSGLPKPSWLKPACVSPRKPLSLNVSEGGSGIGLKPSINCVGCSFRASGALVFPANLTNQPTRDLTDVLLCPLQGHIHVFACATHICRQ